MSGVEDNKDDLDLERKLGETPEKSSRMSGSRGARRSGRRPGRRPAKVDARAKLERSRQSARECRARKKMRYQYLEELMANREQAIFSLRDELETYKQWCITADKGHIPEELKRLKEQHERAKLRQELPASAERLEDRRNTKQKEMLPGTETQQEVYAATAQELPTFLDDI